MTLTFLLPLLSDEARANVKTEHRQTTSQWLLLLPFPRPPLHSDRTRVNPLLPETDILQQEVAKGFRLWEIVPKRYVTLCINNLCNIVPIPFFGNKKIL